ncbi:hypothetical protein ACSLO2_27665, partial [Escherichia coli]
GRTWQLVPFGGASTDPQMLNKRGEMFNSCKTWLRLGGMLDDHGIGVTCHDWISAQKTEMEKGNVFDISRAVYAKEKSDDDY